MTNRELFKKHANATGVHDLGTFCQVLALLDAPAKQEFYGDDAEWIGWPANHCKATRNVAAALVDSIDRAAQHESVRGFLKMRVVLLNGTVIREWPTK